MSSGLVLVATVTAVFERSGASDEPTPTQIAATLIALEPVTTVRIDAHGRPSVFRVDVPDGDLRRAAAAARAIATGVAAALEVGVTILSIALATEDERAEVFREGTPDGDPCLPPRARDQT